MFILLTQIFWTYPYAQDSHVNWEYFKGASTRQRQQPRQFDEVTIRCQLKSN